MAAPALQFRSFRLERFFSKHEFSVKHLLCCSDAEPFAVSELLALASDDDRKLFDSLVLHYTGAQHRHCIACVSLAHAFPEYSGHPLLRAEIAQLFSSAVQPEHVLCVVPQEGILLAHALLSQGAHVVATAPGYQSLYSIAGDLGCEVDVWRPRRSERGLTFELDDLRELLRPNTAMVLTNFPHNPTGYCPTREEWRAIVAAVAATGAVLFSDEMYRGLWSTRPPCEPAVELDEKAISLGGMSKTYGCAGLRVGWLVTRDAAAMERLSAAKDFTTICGSAPSEVLAIMALRHGEALLSRNRAIVSANMPLLNSWFAERSKDFEWTPPAGGGTTGFARIRGTETSERFCGRVLAGCGVLLLPSTEYDHCGGEQCFRIGFGRRDMPAVLAILSAFLAKP